MGLMLYRQSYILPPLKSEWYITSIFCPFYLFFATGSLKRHPKGNRSISWPLVKYKTPPADLSPLDVFRRTSAGPPPACAAEQRQEQRPQQPQPQQLRIRSRLRKLVRRGFERALGATGKRQLEVLLRVIFYSGTPPLLQKISFGFPHGLKWVWLTNHLH